MKELLKMVKVLPDKVPIGRIERSLVEQTKQYKELTGTSTVELVESLLADFFKISAAKLLFMQQRWYK